MKRRYRVRVGRSSTVVLLLLACASDKQPATASNLDAGSDAPMDGAGAVSSGGAGASGGSSGTGGAGGSGNSGGLPCIGVNPAGCSSEGCAKDTVCDKLAGCAPTSCVCNGGVVLDCAKDCHGGVCVGQTDCSALAQSLANGLPTDGSCTAVVRLKYETLRVLSHAFVCGPTVTPDEAEARKAAATDSGFGDGKLLSGATPADEWIFYTEDDFGGVGAVSVRNGQTVFGASIVWTGAGQVLFPTTWQKNDIGDSCAPVARPPARGFNLVSTSVPLLDAEISMVTSTVWRTAIPAALGKLGTVRDVVVLLYAPTVGWDTEPRGMDSSTAEYVVLVNEQ